MWAHWINKYIWLLPARFRSVSLVKVLGRLTCYPSINLVFFAGWWLNKLSYGSVFKNEPANKSKDTILFRSSLLGAFFIPNCVIIINSTIEFPIILKVDNFCLPLLTTLHSMTDATYWQSRKDWIIFEPCSYSIFQRFY